MSAKRVVNDVLVVIGMLWAVAIVSYALASLTMYAYERFTAPLPVVHEKVQEVSPLIDICREVEGGALDARTENGC